LNRLSYDLRKLKEHGLLERDGSRHADRLTKKGIEVALLFLLFHKPLCGPLANSRFHHQPDAEERPDSPLTSCRSSDREGCPFAPHRLLPRLQELESFGQTSPGQERD